ncbi:hypothetical protein GM708_03925 [Vibrio cholerae]|nr:hypothetical protein [Vibrio cholerae]
MTAEMIPAQETAPPLMPEADPEPVSAPDPGQEPTPGARSEEMPELPRYVPATPDGKGPGDGRP